MGTRTELGMPQGHISLRTDIDPVGLHGHIFVAGADDQVEKATVSEGTCVKFSSRISHRNPVHAIMGVG